MQELSKALLNFDFYWRKPINIWQMVVLHFHLFIVNHTLCPPSTCIGGSSINQVPCVKIDQETWLMPRPQYKLWEGTGGKGLSVTDEGSARPTRWVG